MTAPPKRRTVHQPLPGETFGNSHPETDSATTKRQKVDLAERVEELGVEMPVWFYTYSYLSDLKTFERILRSAHLARPKLPLDRH